MNVLKYWSKVFTSQVDHIVSQIENHEALVDCTLRDLQEAAVKANSQLHRIRRDGQAMRAQLDEIRKRRERWEQRALEVRESDRKTALECVKRRQNLLREEAQLERQVLEHHQLQGQLTADLQKIDERITELRRKKNAFSARQARTEAMRIASAEQSRGISEVQEIFERWERKMADFEMPIRDVDELEEKFSSEEEEKLLAETLDRLGEGEELRSNN